jgi:hypothetical protein
MSFDFIARKSGQKKPADIPTTPWWCDDCQKEIDGRDVTYQERHDERAGGCGCNVYPSCEDCENDGWVLSSYQASHPPNFDECERCGNPNRKEHP